MRAETIRRLLVFGVCALGVSALYLVPFTSHSPRVAEPGLRDRPTSPSEQPTPAALVVADAGTRTASPASSDELSSEPTVATTPAVLDLGPAPASSRPSMGTAYVPGPVRDSTPPQAVSTVRLERATEETVTLSWPEASDDVGVTAYRVWLNGYVVSTTAKTSATVRWFNDDTSQQIVQVRAVDAAGNQSQQAASLLTVRPTEAPSPSVTATPQPSDTPTPTSSPTAEAAPKAEAVPSETVSETPR